MKASNRRLSFYKKRLENGDKKKTQFKTMAPATPTSGGTVPMRIKRASTNSIARKNEKSTGNYLLKK